MILPRHPQPLQDEILSSWMVRLAFANGYPVHTFYANLLGCKAPIWTIDTDRHPSLALLNVLNRCSHQSIDGLQGRTLSAFEGILYERLPMTGKCPWILTIGKFHRKRRRAGMQYCPMCLQSDSVPYFRRSWRLALYVMCEHHGCVMQEHCPYCNAPVAYHRLGIGKGETIELGVLARCQICGGDLSQAPTVFFEWPDEASKKTYEELIRGLTTPGLEVGSMSFIFSVLFFSGFHAIVRAVNGKYGHQLRARLSEEFGFVVGVEYRNRPNTFEDQNALDRLKLLLAACWLIEDWPNRFISMFIASEISRFRISHRLQLPFWLSSVADEHLDNRTYVHSRTEIALAGRYLQSQHPIVTPKRFGELLGLTLSHSQTVWHIWHELFVSD